MTSKKEIRKQALKVQRIAKKYVYTGMTAHHTTPRLVLNDYVMKNPELLKKSDPQVVVESIDRFLLLLKDDQDIEMRDELNEMYASSWWWLSAPACEIEELHTMIDDFYGEVYDSDECSDSEDDEISSKKPICDCHLYCEEHAKEFGKLL